MRRFSPDAWLVYHPSAADPDLFGWWQGPKRYVLFNAAPGHGEQVPARWRWVLAAIHRRSLRRADVVTMFDAGRARHLRALGVPPERLVVLLSAPAPKIWDDMPSLEGARLRLGLPPEAPVALCVSRLTAPSNHKYNKIPMILDLLAAVARARADLRLLLVGDDGPGRPAVEEAIVRLGLGERVRLVGVDDRIRLVGSLDTEGLRWFYAACDFYAYPHRADAYWMTLFEAQASGRPVLTMRTPSSEVSVEDGRTGLLARDLEEFAAQVAALAADRGRCQAMGRLAREHIATHHSMDVRIRELEQLLTQQERES
jgi:glycosyltransferase involved in cell wall biosynthesis